MKKFLSSVLVLLMILSMAGCGIKEKLAEKVTEKIFEGAGVEADIDGDKVVVKGEDGQEVTFGAGEWPSSDLAKNIPEFKGGNIVSLMESEDSLFILIEEVSEEDFADYLEDIKESYTEESYVLKTDTGMVYSAVNDSDIGILLTFEKGSGFSITVSKTQQ